MIQIHSHRFTKFHPPRVKESGGRKCLIYKEKNNSLSILSLFHPHLHARPSARVCVSTCECRGERMKESRSALNSLRISVLRRSILSLAAILSPLRIGTWRPRSLLMAAGTAPTDHRVAFRCPLFLNHVPNTGDDDA